MTDNIQTYKFIFRASIGVLNLNANVSSPIVVTWKRSKYHLTLRQLISCI